MSQPSEETKQRARGLEAALGCTGKAESRRTMLAGDLQSEYERGKREAAAAILGIVSHHRNEWIRPSAGTAPLPVGSHACVLIEEAICREFNLADPCVTEREK